MKKKLEAFAVIEKDEGICVYGRDGGLRIYNRKRDAYFAKSHFSKSHKVVKCIILIN
jgi:hypothetical protein